MFLSTQYSLLYIYLHSANIFKYLFPLSRYDNKESLLLFKKNELIKIFCTFRVSEYALSKTTFKALFYIFLVDFEQ